MEDDPNLCEEVTALHRPRYRFTVLPRNAAPSQLALSPVLAESIALSVAAGEAPPTVLLRHQEPYVLLGPDDRRLPDLGAGLDFWRRQGLPVYERVSGGSAVLLDGHCLSFAVARPCRDLTTLHQNYREMAAGILTGLERLGLPARFGAAPGSYCEGPYDVVVHGLKIAGIAQAIRRGFALVSGMILIHQDPHRTTHLINEFYRAAGVERNLKADAVTNLETLLQRPVPVEEVERALRDGFAEHFDLTEEPVRAHEWERARTLVSQRRLA